MMIASDAAASITSDSLIPPGAAWITLIVDLLLRQLRDLVLERLERARDVGLEDDVELLDLALAAFAKTSSRVTVRAWRRASCSVFSRVRALLGELARPALVVDHLDPLAGLADALEAEHLDRVAGPRLLEPRTGVVLHRAHLAPLRPGDDRVADVQRPALDQHRRDRARGPGRAATRSPCPEAGAFGFAFSSSTSATRRIVSSRSSRPSCVFAETLTKIVSPPQSSGLSPWLASSPLTLSGLASGRSILLIATMIGTSAAFAWSIASTVCGITPSSAATTITAMSVTSAPRARIAVNASWPGVSMKVIVLPFWCTW